MPDKKHIERDALPVTVETTDFRKTSGEFTFLFVVHKKYEMPCK